MAAPKLEILAQAVLFRLYEYSQQSDGHVEQSNVPRLLSGKISVKQAALALDILEERDLCYVGRGTYETTATIEKKGYLEVERQLEEADSFIHQYSQHGDEWLFETGGIVKKQETPTGTGNHENDPWEPLPLDLSNSALLNTSEEIDKLAVNVEQDNGYAAEHPDERNFVVAALKAGAEALRTQTTIYRMQFSAFVWEPLSQIASRFGNNAKGLAAAAIKDALKDTIKDILKGDFEKFKDWFN